MCKSVLKEIFLRRVWDQAEADINCMRQPLYPCLQKQLIASYREQFNSSAMNFGTRNGEMAAFGWSAFLDSKSLFGARILWSRIQMHVHTPGYIRRACFVFCTSNVLVVFLA